MGSAFFYVSSTNHDFVKKYEDNGLSSDIKKAVKNISY